MHERDDESSGHDRIQVLKRSNRGKKEDGTRVFPEDVKAGQAGELLPVLELLK